MKPSLVLVAKICVCILACIGLFFVIFRLAMYFHLLDTKGRIDEQSERFWSAADGVLASKTERVFPGMVSSSTEWRHFKNAVLRDSDVLKKVEWETGLSARMLISAMAAEQMRFYYSNRGWFERVLRPKNLMATMTHASWGILGIKEETAKLIEKHASDKDSPFYPGSKYEHLLDFPDVDDIGAERFSRLTDPDDHYYSYLYAALYNKQIIEQWRREGFDISRRPEILATLFNIGFQNSIPKLVPKSGGSVLQIGGSEYSFGQFAGLFYYSQELAEEFPAR